MSLVHVSVIMQQPVLFDSKTVNSKIDMQHVSATFTKIADKMHEVVLEINSHKFLLKVKAGVEKLEHFEVLAVKGFVDI